MRTAGEETKTERMSSAFLSGAVAQFGRAPRSQCGGQGFDPPLLHHLFSTIYSRRQRWLFWPSGQYVTNFSRNKLYCLHSSSLASLNHSDVTHRYANIRVSEKLRNRESIATGFGQSSPECGPEIFP